MAGVFVKVEEEGMDSPAMCFLGNHPLDNPRLLPCHHSFCTVCIKSKLQNDMKEFVCPRCQLPIPLTEKQVDELPEDVLYHVMQGTKDDCENCVVCKFEDRSTLGTFQCLDCADVLCENCHEGHTKSSFTKFHRLASMKDIQEGKYKREIQDSRQLVCPTHSTPNTPMILQLYCEECKRLACQICVLTHHQPKGHTCKTIDEVHDEKTMVVHDHVIDLLALKQTVEGFMFDLDQELEIKKDVQDTLENEVYQRAEHFIDIIEKVKEKTLKVIRDHFETEENTIQKKQNEAKKRSNRIESLVNYTKAFLKHSAKSQFLQHGKAVIKMLTDQKQEHFDKTLQRNILEIGKPLFAQTEEFITQAFGKIGIKPKEPESSVTRILRTEPKILFNENPGTYFIYDVAVTGNEDIVTVTKSTLQVFHSDGKHKETIFCSAFNNAWNVVAKGDSLYISDKRDNGYVLVLDLKGNEKKTLILPPSSQGYQHKGLAVDDDGNVYISSSKTHSIYKCVPSEIKAKMFIPQGKHPDLRAPCFLGVTPGGEVVVSNSGSNFVQVYDRRGEFLWQYGGQGVLELWGPRGVCCDKEGFIYIVDRYNNRIQIIKNGIFKGLVRVAEFPTPFCIDLDHDGNIICGTCHSLGAKIAKMKVWDK